MIIYIEINIGLLFGIYKINYVIIEENYDR